MDSVYGCAVTNKFDLFLDEEADPYEILAQQESLKKKDGEKPSKDQKVSKSTKNKKNKTVAAPVVETKQSGTVDNEKRPSQKKFEDRPARFQGTGDQENRPPRRRNDDNRPPQTSEFRSDRTDRVDRADRGDRPEGSRGRGRGRGGVAGGRGGRGGFDRFGKREFDRHSGNDKTSGVKAVDKREGGGSRNWGTIKDDIDEEFDKTSPNQSMTETPAPDTPEMTPEGGAVDEGSTEPVPDPEPTQMTLDEWKAQQQAKKKETHFNIRRAGEGVDESQWKKTTVLKKPPREEEEEEESDEEEEEYETRKSRSQANELGIQITFSDTRRGGRGEGRGEGRGGGRGERGEGRGRGGGRGGGEGRGGGRGRGRGRGGFGEHHGGGSQRESAAPNIQSDSDFPALG